MYVGVFALRYRAGCALCERSQQQSCHYPRCYLARANVQISDPQTQSSGFLGSFTTYLLTSSMAGDGVRRRYSDWDWLRELLVARYHGVAVPLLPEKRVVGNQNKNFIEERMQGLENWCASRGALSAPVFVPA